MANAGDEKEKRREGPWSDLPTELMELILEKCNFSDQARLRAVCRKWQSIPPVQPMKQLPWLMAYDPQNWSRCKLFDLTYSRTYTINFSTVKEYYQEQSPYYMRICDSKFGWLLVSHPISQCSKTAFVLYSPFTNSMIKLPHLQLHYHWESASFSADPASAYCVFFVLYAGSKTTVVRTCRLGDTKWTTHVFPGRFLSPNDVVYSQGHFWCANRFGTLGTFSVAQGTWNVLELQLPMETRNQETYFVESNGDLLVVFIRREGEDKWINVYKLDRSQMKWIWVEDIGDRTIFLGSFSLSASAVPEKLGVTGRVHCCWSCESAFYSEHYGSPTIEEHLRKIWIEPPS